jgi:hypothetical protein
LLVGLAAKIELYSLGSDPLVANAFEPLNDIVEGPLPIASI